MDKKILLEISAQKNSYLNCYDNNIIYDIARYYKCDCKLSFLGEFDFTYRNIENVKSLLEYNDIYTGDILYVPYFLSEFFGISISHIEVNEKEKYEKFVDMMLNNLNNNLPIGIGIDSYYLKWNPQFKKLHRRHYFLIVGINLDESIIYCIDSYLSNEVQKIPISNVYNKYDRLILIEKVTPKRKISLNFILDKLMLCLSHSGKDRNCDAIRKFANSITNPRFMINDRATIHMIENSNLFFRLTDIANCRYNFLQALICLKESFKITNMEDILEETYYVYENWKNVKGVLLKGYISGRVSKSLERASAILNKIADNEEIILNKLLLLNNQ